MSIFADPGARSPNVVDLHVGSRVRVRRKMLGVSQQALARAVGRTFQQVQKYERGETRISASKLYEIAATLQAPISFFFDGLEEPATAMGDGPGKRADLTISQFLATDEGQELAQTFPRLGDRLLRRRILDLTQALAEEHEAACRNKR